MEIEIGANLLVAIKNIVFGLVGIVAIAGLLKRVNEPKEKKGGGKNGDIRNPNSGRKKSKGNV